MADFESNKAILDRAAEILGFSGHGSKKQLSKHLGISTAVLSGWRSRNQIDYEVLRDKLTDEQFLYATKGVRQSISSFGPEDYVSRTEFLEQMLAMSKRIDRLEASSKAWSEKMAKH